ncbi:MAG: translocation/assembly module TamB domain-containing protein [Alphaproteobacteria bacterium]|nr:translocation/assembly module TamB domain-containing protein [Alphaproteobacteria bacterium]MBU0795892.1 translocation/assembly module TamB domain-containing protein [Alphaproteobacteria bacterium]MBU1812261.1 translocation/assembly module TamB domain-containing protein [Alphaproteobacteria bacterium]
MSDTEVKTLPPARAPQPRRRLPGRIAAATALALGGVVALLAVAVMALDTGPGRRWAEGLANDLAGDTLAIEGVRRLALFDRVEIDRVWLKDADGVWMSLENAVLDWRPSALLQRRLAIGLITADTIRIDRAPLPGPQEDPAPEEGGITLPLPIGLYVERLAAQRIELGAALAGTAATLRAMGSLRLPRDARDTAITLSVERLDAPATATLAGTYDATTDRVTLDIDVAEPEGGVLVGLLQVPDRPAFRLTAKGAGPLDGFTTTLTAEAGPDLALDATIGVSGATDRRITVTGTARPDALLPPDIRPLLPEGLRFDAEALVPASGPIALDHLTLDTGSATLTSSGTIDPGSLALDLIARLETPLSPYGALAEQPLDGQATLDVTAKGTPQDLALTLDARTTGLRLDGTVPPVIGDAAHLQAAGQLGDAGSLRVDSLNLTAGPLQASGSGRYAPGDAELILTAALDDLARLSEIGIEGLAGRLDLDATLGQTGANAYRAMAKARMTGLETGTPAARALLGEEPTLDLMATIDAGAGTAQIDRLVLDAPGLSLDGSGAAWADFQMVNGKLSIAIPRLRELGQVIGTPMAGALTALLTLDGGLDALTADAKLDWRNGMIAGQSLGTVAASLALDGVAADDPQGLASKGKLRVTATPPGTAKGKPAVLETNLAYGKDRRLNLDALRLEALGLAARGGLAIDLSSALVAGKLTGRIDDIQSLAGLAGQQAGGEISFALELAGTGGRQHAGGVVTGKSLSLNDGAITLDGLRLEAQLADVTGKPSGPVMLKAGNITAGGQTVSSLEANAELKGDRIDLTASLTGKDLTASTQATLQQARRDTTITIARLDAKWRELVLKLNRPLVATLGPDGQALDGLDMSVDRGRLAGSARLSASAVAADLALTGLPLRLLQRLDLGPRLGGTAEARLTLSGRPDNPDGRATLTMTGVAPTGPSAPDVPPADIAAEARLANGQLALEAALTRLQGAQFQASATLPMQVNLTQGQFLLPPSGAVKGTLTIAADLRRLVFVALALGEDRVEGNVEGTLDLAGTIANPVLSGQASLRQGRYINDATGATLQNINLDIAGEGQSLVLRDVKANDSEGGRLTGAGRISFAGGGTPEVDVKLTLQRLRLINREEGTAVGSGELTLTNDPRNGGDSLLFTGRTRIDQADIRIPDTLPPSVTSLDVREINIDARTNIGERAKQRQIARQKAATAPRAPGLMDGLRLDLITEIPGQVYVRGRGLDAEFRGTVQVSGTATAPVIRGDVSVVRGVFNFAGQRFNLDRGNINLIPSEGGGLEIALDILAVANVADIEAQIAIAGEVLEPQITLNSSPSLPQDEILSRILFGTNTGSLTAGQAARLAQSALELTGKISSGGVVDDLRQSFGLDTLEVDAGDGNSGAGVRAGRYINDKLFIGVNQGLGAESSAVVVEYRFLKNVTIESRIGAASAGDIGIVYERRY